MTERWVWVSLPWATFALAAKDGRITQAPPIARWATGRDEREVAAYYRRRGAVFRDLPVPAEVAAGGCHAAVSRAREE